MLNYLYYKLYQATLKGSLRDIPQYMAPVFLGVSICANILVINAFLAKIDVMPFLFSNKKQAAWICVILIMLAILYYNKSRREAILKKHSHESNKSRIRGNIIVSMYVAVSFLSIFAVAFFRPGKL
jgi:hypothetical protein